NNPVLTVNPTTMTFAAPFAGQTPASQTAQVGVGGTSGSISFSVSSNQPWLTASASQNTVSAGNPATLTVSVNQGSLAVGTYNGIITLTPNTTDNYTQSINVTLTVGTTAQLSAGPSVLLFSYQQTRTPPADQVVQIRTTGVETSFSTPAITYGGTACAGNNW